MPDKLSKVTQGKKSCLTSEVQDCFSGLEAWQVKEIKAALKEADKQNFISEKEFSNLVKKHIA